MRAVGISYLFLGAGHPSCPESGRCCQPLWKVLETFASYLFVAEKKNKADFFFFHYTVGSILSHCPTPSPSGKTLSPEYIFLSTPN